MTMKVAIVFSIQLCLLVLTECVRNQIDPLSKFREVQRFKPKAYDSPNLIDDDCVVLVESQNGLKTADKISRLPGQPRTPSFNQYSESQNGLKTADKISRLPGQPRTPSFNQYSGYVTVDSSHGRALFYYFAETPIETSTRPLVLWLNGGPGCSSLGGGAMMELGPFRVNEDGKTLSVNDHSWIQVANILFLESPAGVGFSYSNTSSDYKTGDKQTAKDSYTFLINWLERFPEYKTRDFYITGESYAGHYIPQLAELILQRNKKHKHTVINLKGIAIGNAYIDDETQEKGTHDFWWYRSMISDGIHDGIVKNCDFSWNGTISSACQAYINEENKMVGHLYPYNIYAPLCVNGTFAKASEFDPCSDKYIESYLNLPQVRKSLHAYFTGLPGIWKDCNDQLYNDWTDQPFSVLPSIKRLMGSGIRFWIYSGDTDSSVPVTTTEYALKKLNATIKTPWYPWYQYGEVGGYAVEYEGLTFLTVRGAGHFIPSYQPARALAVFSSFLNGKPPVFM